MINLIVATYLYTLRWSYRGTNWVELKDNRNITFRIDNSFNTEERVKIEQALQRWVAATKGHVNLKCYVGDVTILDLFKFKSDGIPTIYNAISPLSWKRHLLMFGSDNYHSDTIGMALSFIGDIFIMKGGKDFEDLVTHEVGHILIATPWHSKDPKSVMYPTMHEKYEHYEILQEEVDIIRGKQ